MNKKVIASMSLMVVANLVTVFYVNHQMLGMQKTVDEMRCLTIQLPPELESKLEGDLDKLVQSITNSANNAVASITTDVNGVVADMKQDVVATKKTADEAYARLTPMVQSLTESLFVSVTTDVNRVVADMKHNVVDAKKSTEEAFGDATQMMHSAILDASSNLVRMCRSKVLGNELEAERSYQKAVQVLDDGDFALAKLYCMNAINHSPTKKLYFEKLLEISANAGNETRDDLEQIKGALELGIFQVAADDVLGMRNMLAGVIEKLNKMDVTAQLSREEEEKAAFDQALTSLRKGDLSYDSVIGANNEERLVLLQQRLAILRDIDKTRLATNDVAWVEEQLARTRASLEYFGLVNSIDSYLFRAQKLLEEEPPKLGSVNVMVQTASQLLSQAFGIETACLPITAQDKLQMFAKWIEAIEVKFNKIKSKPAIAEIHALIAKVDRIEVMAPYQAKIDSINECLLMISQKLTMVFDPDTRNSFENEIKKLSIKLGKCRQAQYKAYQSWAIERCNEGMERYRKWHRVDIPDAELVVYRYLINIDSTLLSPDVARLYQDVLGKQFDELKDHTVKVEIDLARHNKKQLSDF